MDPDSPVVQELASVERWIEQARRGEARAFNHLVDRYSHALYKLAYGQCRSAEAAQDCCQEAWLSAWRSFDRFNGDAEGIQAWLSRIVINACRDRLRYEQRRPSLPLELEREGETRAIPLPQPGQSPQEYAEAQDLDALLEACLARLSPEHREVLLLGRAELDYAEIASILDIELGTVKSRMSRARARMRDLLRGEASLGKGSSAREPGGGLRRSTAQTPSATEWPTKSAGDTSPGPTDAKPS